MSRKPLISFVLLLFFTFFADSTLAFADIRLQVWHQMIYSHREVLAEVIREFERQNPNIQVDLTYRETEELRSSFQAASMGGSGPDLVYGPSDQVGPFATMGILMPLDAHLSPEELSSFDPRSLVRFDRNLLMIGHTLGNHLMLITNRRLVPTPPQTTSDIRSSIVWNLSEPFFFAPWVSAFGESLIRPDHSFQLNRKGIIQAISFVRGLQSQGLLPLEADYEVANALFKEGKASMIVNGDWSWSDYEKAGIDFDVSPLPVVSTTGYAPRAYVAARGYSLNRNLSGERLNASLLLLRHLVSEEVQEIFLRRLHVLPSRTSLFSSPYLTESPKLKASLAAIKGGEMMPIAPEMRAVWDALRRHLQGAWKADIDLDSLTQRVQEDTDKQIQEMNEILKPGRSLLLVFFIFTLILIWIIYKIYQSWPQVRREIQGANRFAFLMMLPSAIGIGAVVVYPFFYNIMISISNLSLKTFSSWELIGLHHYFSVLYDPNFYDVLGKTMAWTFVNIFAHTTIGIGLALLINQTLPAKPLFRILLIIPWAIPQYITALTWRGLFNYEYGAINQVITRLLHLSPVEWLSRPFEAFSACILTNIWLGFPFIMVVALAGLQSIPPQLYEAARIDGSNSWQTFWRITLPLLWPVLIPSMTLGFIWTFNNLNVIWLVSNGGEPGDQVHILVSYVYKAAFNLYRYGYSAAISMINFMILLSVSLFYLGMLKRRDQGAAL